MFYRVFVMNCAETRKSSRFIPITPYGRYRIQVALSCVQLMTQCYYILYYVRMTLFQAKIQHVDLQSSMVRRPKHGVRKPVLEVSHSEMFVPVN